MCRYVMQKVKHVDWEVFSSENLGPTAISHDQPDVDLNKESEKNLASIIELYTHVLKEGINTWDFFNRDMASAPMTCNEKFMRKLFFAF